MEKISIKTIDDYIASCPVEVQLLLENVRQTIRDAAPMAEETINYQIPTFKWYGNLVHFGAFKNHIGFYPGASGIANFENELSAFPKSKGSVKFSFDNIPYHLITKIVNFRLAENELIWNNKPEKKAKTKK